MANLNGKSCHDVDSSFAKNNGSLTCKECKFDVSKCTKCGNEIVDIGEECDGNNLDGKNCATINKGFVDGKLECTNNCSYDITACQVCYFSFYPSQGKPGTQISIFPKPNVCIKPYTFAVYYNGEKQGVACYGTNTQPEIRISIGVKFITDYIELVVKDFDTLKEIGRCKSSAPFVVIH